MKAYFESYGCSLNYGETEIMRQMAAKRGWELVNSLDDADVIVISTCVVVQATEARMKHRLKELAGLDKTLVVFGCMASSMADKVKRLAPQALLLRPDQLEEFNDLLEQVGPEKGLEETGVHVNIPIANGCRGECTFCITRIARGELKSNPKRKMIKRVRTELSKGRKEIRLTAQDSALYGADLGKGTDLPRLLDSICSIDDRFMVRVGMMNPNSLKEILVPLAKAYKDPKVFNFLHLPVQSGSDTVLEKMARGYSVDGYIKVLERFGKKVPDLYLSTDVIAGFPGETEEDFKATRNLLERIRPDILNIKAFSARPGTKAKTMKGRVDTKVVKERTRVLSRIRNRITRENLREFVGKEVEILLTERPKPRTTMGRTPDYRPIIVNGELELGDFVRVRITGSRHSYLVGKPI